LKQNQDAVKSGLAMVICLAMSQLMDSCISINSLGKGHIASAEHMLSTASITGTLSHWSIIMDENAVAVCEELADAIFPHAHDDDKRMRVFVALLHFMEEAKKGIAR
jgi:hypothetical protein